MSAAIPLPVLSWLRDEDGAVPMPLLYAGLLALVVIAVGGDSAGHAWERTGISLTWGPDGPVLQLP